MGLSDIVSPRYPSSPQTTSS